ncbi:uncharacterized protein LOC143923219 [Arctopsyche grandis]|uniref:uncharacterized protein LOC143923219 n=1 Tax=Arctopsyche grandis TaxID=121162 RepID=UPI00406D63BA
MRTTALQTVEAAAQQLEGLAFEGFYVERRLARPTIDGCRQPQPQPLYCAAIVLPPEEHDLSRQLQQLAEQLHSCSPQTRPSFEIGPPPCLLAQIEVGPLGCYWFLINSVNLESDAVVFHLHPLRHLPHKSLSSTSTNSNASANVSNVNFNTDLPFKVDFELVTNVLKFISIVLTASIVGAFKAIEFLGNFTIRFMHEASFFVEKSTPMFHGTLNFLARFTSAVLAFFTMMIRGNQPIRVQNFPPVEYNPNEYRRNRRSRNFD